MKKKLKIDIGIATDKLKLNERKITKSMLRKLKLIS